MLNVADFAIRVVSQFGLLFVPATSLIDGEFEPDVTPEQDHKDATSLAV